MVLVLILLGIIIFFLFLFNILLLSTLQIEIKNLKIENKEIENKKRIKDKYKIKISLYFLKKIPILWLTINHKKMEKIYHSKPIEKIDLKKLENKVPSQKEILELIKNIKIKIIQLTLEMNIGTEDAILTSYLIAMIASLIGIILPHLAKENIHRCHYVVNPRYRNKNEYAIAFDSIIQIKIVHIIYSMCRFIKKGRDKNERTSNRRSYAYRYE